MKTSRTTKYTRKKTLKCWNCHTIISLVDNEIVAEKKTVCPHCKSLYPEKPINEAKLSILQEQYLQTRDIKVLNKMMLLMQDLAYNLICSKLKASGKFLDEETILDKVQWTLLKMTEYYSRPSFKIGTSFTEYLSQVVLYPLYNYKTKDKDKYEISINTPLKEKSADGREQTLLDKIGSEPYLDGYFEAESFFFQEEMKNNLIKMVQDYIKSTVTIVYKKKSFSDALKVMILYNHFLNNRENKFFNKWWKVEGFDFRDSFEKSLNLLRETIYESAKG